MPEEHEHPSSRPANAPRSLAVSAGQIARTAITFAAILAAASCLIYFGSRGDSATVARSVRSGVLTADTVSAAFEKVSARLVKRDILESQHVSKGDVLMQLDPTDTDIAIARMKALAAAQKANLASEENSIRITGEEIARTEKAQWRQIEELEAALVSARSAKELATREFGRSKGLVREHAVSQSQYDAASDALTRARNAVLQAERALSSAVIGASDEELARLAKTGSAEGMHLAAIANSRATLANRSNTVAALAAQIAQTEADLRQLQVNRSRLTLTAPDSGKILNILYEAGELVPAGASAVELETDRRYFDIYVNENEAARFAPGAQIQAWVPALGKPATATVRFCTPAPSFADIRSVRERGQADLTSFKVRLYAEPTEGLVTGMTLEVRDE